MAAMWTRIWWVRPLWSESSSRVVGASPPRRSTTVYAVRAGLPPAVTAILVGVRAERPIGASTSPRSSATTPATSAR